MPSTPNPAAKAGAAEVRVEDAFGRLVGWTDEQTARDLIASGLASFYRDRGKRSIRKHERRPEDVAERSAVSYTIQSSDYGFDPRRLWGWRSPSPFDQYAGRERSVLMKRLIGELTRRQQCLVRLRYTNDLTFDAIGRAMRITADGAMRLHSRALDVLLEKLLAVGIRGIDDV